jgi:hypothetical protein
MHRVLRRRPSPATAVAFLALMVALAPVAVAATKAVGRAMFATNAGKVDGFKASRTPKPNQLLALDRKARFPASVISGTVAGPKGDRGDTGAKGDPGTPGASVAARVTATGPVTIPGGAVGMQIPLSGNGWTQGASELDLFALKITVTQPAGCSTFTGVAVNISAGATTILQTFVPISAGQSTTTMMGTPLFEPGASSIRTVTATASNNCSTNASASVDAINVDVIRGV